MLRRYVDLPREIHILCLGVLINRAGTFLLPFLTIYLSQRLGFGGQFATTAIGVYGAGAIVGAMIGGHVADRFGRKIAMLIALFGSAAIMIGFSFLTSPAAILAASFVLPMVADMYRPAVQAFIADVVEPIRRPDAFGLNYITINLGAAFGPLIGGVLAEHSFTWLFYGDAATTAVCGIVIAIAIPESLGRVRSGGAEPRSSPATESAESKRSTSVSASGGRRYTLAGAAAHIVRDRVFMLFCLATLFVALVYSQWVSTLPLYLEILGIGPKPYSRLIAINGALIVLCQIFVTAAVTRFDRGSMLAIGALLTALGYGMKSVMAVEWQFAICVVIWTIGEMMAAPLIGPVVADLAPAELRARYMAVVTMAFSGSNMLAAPVGGAILENWGGVALWRITFFVASLAAVTYFCIRRRIARHAAAN